MVTVLRSYPACIAITGSYCRNLSSPIFFLLREKNRARTFFAVSKKFAVQNFLLFKKNAYLFRPPQFAIQVAFFDGLSFINVLLASGKRYLQLDEASLTIQ